MTPRARATGRRGHWRTSSPRSWSRARRRADSRTPDRFRPQGAGTSAAISVHALPAPLRSPHRREAPPVSPPPNRGRTLLPSLARAAAGTCAASDGETTARRPGSWHASSRAGWSRRKCSRTGAPGYSTGTPALLRPRLRFCKGTPSEARAGTDYEIVRQLRDDWMVA